MGTARPEGERDAFERQLGERLIRGQTGDAAALWDHFAPLVRGLLVRALGPDEDVEDGMQEVFMRVYQKGRALRDPALLRSYVVAITVHYIRSQFRRRRVRRLFGRMSPPPQELQAVEQPAATLAVRALFRSLERLPTEERMAFTLRFIEGVDLAEAAHLSNLSLATFKRRLAAAKDRLWTLTGQDPCLAPYLLRDDLRSVRNPEGEA